MEEIEGDLFSAPIDYHFVHCVGADYPLLSYSCGIAKEFRRRYGASIPVTNVGKLAIIQAERIVIHLITKETCRTSRPTLESMKECLISLANYIRENKIMKLAMPKIGCGLDRLEWTDVKKLIEDILIPTGVKILIYYL